MRNHSWSAEKLRIEESEPQPDLYEYSKEIEKEISNKEYMQFQLMTVTASGPNFSIERCVCHELLTSCDQRGEGRRQWGGDSGVANQNTVVL